MLLLLQAGKVPMTRGDQAIFENRRHSYTDIYIPKEPEYTPPPAQAPGRNNAHPPMRNAVEEFIIEIKPELKRIVRQSHIPEAAIDPLVNQMAEHLRNQVQANPMVWIVLQDPLLREMMKVELLECARILLSEALLHLQETILPKRMRVAFPNLFWSELKAMADFFNAVQDLKRHNAHALDADKINLEIFEAISTPEKLADTIRENRWERLYRQLTLPIHSDKTVVKSERTRELATVVMGLLVNLSDMIKDTHQASMENSPASVLVGPIKNRL